VDRPERGSIIWTAPTPRLKEKYENEVVPALMQRFEYKNVMEVPKVEKVIVNRGVSDAIVDPKALDAAADELAEITGQRPIITRAEEVNRSVQAACRSPDRLQSNASWRKDVLFPG